MDLQFVAESCCIVFSKLYKLELEVRSVHSKEKWSRINPCGTPVVMKAGLKECFLISMNLFPLDKMF